MNKEAFKGILSETSRKGVDLILALFEELGVFVAPASSKFHLSCKGGLLEHSMNVYNAAMMIREQAVKTKPELEE